MNATSQRQRNRYSWNCQVCRDEVKAGAGWLYCDTLRRPRRTSEGLTRYPMVVKCDRCHLEELERERAEAETDARRYDDDRFGELARERRRACKEAME